VGSPTAERPCNRGHLGSESPRHAIREHGKTLEAAVTADPTVLAPLKLHYLKWLLFETGDGLYFQYQGIFDTDFDKYTEDAVALFQPNRYHHHL
jgi:hypothetical protein